VEEENDELAYRFGKVGLGCEVDLAGPDWVRRKVEAGHRGRGASGWAAG
jgi:hypothetical protein